VNVQLHSISSSPLDGIVLPASRTGLFTRVSKMKILNIYINKYHGRYGVLIHDSYPDVRLFHSLLRGGRFSFTMASTAAMASGVTTRCA